MSVTTPKRKQAEEDYWSYMIERGRFKSPDETKEKSSVYLDSWGVSPEKETPKQKAEREAREAAELEKEQFEEDEFEAWNEEMRKLEAEHKEKLKARREAENAEARLGSRLASDESRILHAAKYGDTDKVRSLLANNRDLVHATNSDGMKPLDYANKYGHSQTARVIQDFH